MPEFRYHGFESPPVGLIDVIQSSTVNKDAVIYIIDPIGSGLPPYDELQQLNRDHLWVVINTHEPATYRWFDRLLDHLTQRCGIAWDRIILHSSCLYDPDSPIRLISSIVDYATDIVSQLGNEIAPGTIKHHFVCLNRQHRWQRKSIVQLLQQRGLDQFGKISYLTETRAMVLDRSEVSWDEQRDISHPDIKNAAINIITETGYEPEYQSGSIVHHYRPAITEKTFKSIYLCQYPVWVSAQYTVGCYRDLGFDAFDDIVDHGYDSESDPRKRLELVIAEIERLTKISTADWESIRQKHLDRFRSNLNRLVWYNLNHRSELPKWNQIFC